METKASKVTELYHARLLLDLSTISNFKPKDFKDYCRLKVQQILWEH